MTRILSEETRKKIGESLRIYHEIRKADSPVIQRMNSFQDAFLGQTGIQPEVRNYGGFGVDKVEGVQSGTKTREGSLETEKK